ncbi:MAG TPA: ATP-binding protein [Actinomycetes bacterium]
MELSIPAAPAQLAAVRRAARSYLHGVAGEVADDVVLALHEAASNAVLHGSSSGQPVKVVLRVTEQCIEASVLDHGQHPPAPADGDAAELGTHGRGLWLLRGLVDEVRIERVRHGTRVTLRRCLGPPRALAH